MALRMLDQIPRPSSMADTMVEKLSSVRMRSAAPLATSVPERPIAQPMSAAFRAGASFTPSPVIATTQPRFCQAFTMRILCSGDTRAEYRKALDVLLQGLLRQEFQLRPVTARSPGR